MELNQIYCADNVEFMRQLPDEFVDLVVTSPPYDNVYPGPEGELITDFANGLRTYNGYTWDFAATARELWRIIKPGGVVVWVVGDATVNGSETGSSFRQALYFMEVGFNCETMIYHKSGAIPKHNHRNYPSGFEFMFILSKGYPNVFNLIKDRPNKQVGKFISGTVRLPDGTLKKQHNNGQLIEKFGARDNVWKYNTGYFDKASEKCAFDHPAIFPEALAADHIRSWSLENQIVLDPFCGSGTVPKMCAILNRRYIGIDCSQEYCDLAQKRVDNITRELNKEWKPMNGSKDKLEDLPLFAELCYNTSAESNGLPGNIS